MIPNDAANQSTITLALTRPGTYHVGIRYSPYLVARETCISEAADGMTRLVTRRTGEVQLAFALSASGALDALTGSHTACFKDGEG